MTVRDFLARADRLQRNTRYKIVATIASAVLIYGALAALMVIANEPGQAERVAERMNDRAREARSGSVVQQGPIDVAARALDSLYMTIRPVRGVRADQVQPQAPAPDGAPGAPPPPPEVGPAGATGVLGVTLVFTAFALGVAAIIWLNLSLTYLSLFVLGWGVGAGLMAIGPIAGVGRLLVAVTPLVLVFLTMMEGLRLALSWPSPVMAVARNLLQEAVRMKISLVFIVLLMLLLAVVPQSLNAEQPLRYRVQQWLQYGTGLSYVVLVLLTLFLSVATISYEQRERVIWQTMTKPVSPWQYLLGKWLGVMALNAVLLTVTAGGVYIFTEYLRRLPAQQELAYNIREDGVITSNSPALMTEDRRLLETQVLVARRGVRPSQFMGEGRLQRAVNFELGRKLEQDNSLKDTPELRAQIREELLSALGDAVEEQVTSRIADAKSRDPQFQETPQDRDRILREVLASNETLYRTIPPGSSKTYFMTGLENATKPGAPEALTLRYQINAGSNDPSALYRLLITINGASFERQVALKTAQTMNFSSALVTPEGTLDVNISSSPDNEREMVLPDDGLEVLYIAGGYEANFMRIVMVMLVKLSFIAAVAIASATFLSFPVACLVSLTVLLAAESAGFLWESLEYYQSRQGQDINWFAVLVRAIAVPISLAFRSYAELKPTESLVDGRLISWSSLVSTVLLIGGWTIGVLGIGWAIFRQRELATYSGR